MNNEEKILEILGAMQNQMGTMQADISELKQDARKLNGRIAVVEEFKTPLNLILESQVDANRNIEDLKDRMERVENKLDEAVVIKVASKV